MGQIMATFLPFCIFAFLQGKMVEKGKKSRAFFVMDDVKLPFLEAFLIM